MLEKIKNSLIYLYVMLYYFPYKSDKPDKKYYMTAEHSAVAVAGGASSAELSAGQHSERSLAPTLPRPV